MLNRTTPSMIANVQRHTLSNGLTVLLKENHTAPVAALLIHVKAGYFNEPDQWNGIAHVIEHMMFKGTPTRPEPEQVAREIQDLGGYINAGTYYEETGYYVVVPSKNLERVIEVHADSIQNSLFDADELSREIEVIVQESLQKRDNPTAMLIESLNTLTFDQHRIRRWRIGHPETLRGFTRDDLVQFTQAYYRPENMILTLVGDFDAEQALEWVEREWGEMARGVFQPDFSPVEPLREEFRYQRILGETRQRLITFAFPAPPELHPDAAPLLMLTSVLSDGRSARLFRRLKEELQIASTAWASYEGFSQMGLFRLGAESLQEDPLAVELALWEEIRRVQEELATSEELERVRNRIETRRLSAQEEVLGMARALANYEAIGDYHLSETLLAQLKAVTPLDIQRVAQTYLRLETVSLLEYIPNNALLSERTAMEIEAKLHCVSRANPTASFHVQTHALEGKPQVIDLPHGGRLVYQYRADLPLVAIQALFRGGKRRETRSNSGITNLMLKSTMKGTRNYSAEALSNAIESLGASIGPSLGMDYLGYSLKLKRDALKAGFALYSEILTEPRFHPEEIEREQQAIASEIRRQQDSIGSLSMDLVNSAIFGEVHPYGLPSAGVLDAVKGLAEQELREWHREHFYASNLYVGVVGDLSPEEAVTLFENLLPQGSPEALQTEPLLATVSPSASRHKTMTTQKQQTATAIAFQGTTLYAEERPELEVLTEIASGMGGRFFRSVRGENALAYQVSCFHRSRQDAGNVIAYTSTAPENAEKARELLLQECRRFQEERVTEQELASAKASLQGEYVIERQTFGAQAGEWAALAVYGLAPEESQKYLDQLDAVTASEIQAVAQKYLDTERYWLGLVSGGEMAKRS